jgi:hypothetical protein
MTDLFLGIILIATAFLTLGCQSNTGSLGSSNAVPNREATWVRNDNSVSGAVPSDIEEPRYLGCWRGMNSGRIRITGDKIYDLGSSESSTYKPVKSISSK